ncbi:MAG: hypothetical protein AB7S80_06840 [Rhizobiaceae bacterium]
MPFQGFGVLALRCAAATAGAFACLLVYVSAPLAGFVPFQPPGTGLENVQFDMAAVIRPAADDSVA